MNIQIWHKATCSTSRKALDFITQRSDSVEIRDYIANPPSEVEIREVLKKMNATPIDILRKKEPLFKEKFAGCSLTDDEWISVLASHPIFIERPIVIAEDKAWLARPFDAFADSCLL